MAATTVDKAEPTRRDFLYIATGSDLDAYDISNPYQPQEVATFVPPPPKGTPAGAVQLNDVFVDEREIVYTVDRHTGGLYTLEMDF